MPKKWADYVITAVEYNRTRDRIETVEVREDNGDKISGKLIWTRHDVIQHIAKRYTFVTAYKRNGKWSKGASVEIFERNGEKFLRTEGNDTDVDNLGELPELTR